MDQWFVKHEKELPLTRDVLDFDTASQSLPVRLRRKMLCAAAFNECDLRDVDKMKAKACLSRQVLDKLPADSSADVMYNMLALMGGLFRSAGDNASSLEYYDCALRICVTPMSLMGRVYVRIQVGGPGCRDLMKRDIVRAKELIVKEPEHSVPPTMMATADLMLRCTCSNCGTSKIKQPMPKCSGCDEEHYCSMACAREHWMAGHKHVCTRSLFVRITCSGCDTVWDVSKVSEVAGPMKACRGCRQVRYCNADCQRRHWYAEHRATCKAAIDRATCNYCWKVNDDLCPNKKCTGCNFQRYCSKACQRADWSFPNDDGHRLWCTRLDKDDV